MASQPSEHLQNDSGNPNLKGNEYQQQQQQQQQEILTKLQNGGQVNSPSIPPVSTADMKGMKSPPSNGNSGSHGAPNEMISGYHPSHQEGIGLPPSQHHPHMHHPGSEKDELPPPHHQQQHPMYGHQPMHPMHAPQQHIPGHHLPMHPHQQRYHPHAGPPHGPMQHTPMHPHDPNQQQMDPYAHYRGMMGPRPPQRYGMPPQGPLPNNTQNVPAGGHPQTPGGNQQQGPTPTLNSLLQSQPSPQSPQSAPPHRYPNPNPYDPYVGPPVSGPPVSGSSSPMPTQSQQQQQQQQQQQGWVPPPRPYSPQQYRGPPPTVSFKLLHPFYACASHTNQILISY